MDPEPVHVAVRILLGWFTLSVVASPFIGKMMATASRQATPPAPVRVQLRSVAA